MTTIRITGIGIVSPLGIGKEAFADACARDAVGIGELTYFEPPGACEHAAEVHDYDWQDSLFTKQSYADRATQFALGAARLALEDGEYALPIEDGGSVLGLCYGTEWGCLETNETFYEPLAAGKGKRASSLVFSHSYPNCPTSFVAIELGLRGYSTSFAGTPLAGLHALRSAFDALNAGTADRILVGASEALSAPLLAHLEANGEAPATAGKTPPATTTDGDAGLWSRVPGEGAAFLLLETGAASEGKSSPGVIEAVEEGEPGDAEPTDWCWGRAGAVAPLYTLARALLADDTQSLAFADGEEGIAVRIAPA